MTRKPASALFAALTVGSLALGTIALTAPRTAGAQSASEYITQGNAAYDARKVSEALADYDRALAIECGFRRRSDLESFEYS